MPKSVRIKATPHQDKNIQFKLEQDFDLLEILSLKIVKSDVYTRMCADYGVIVGRAVANSGFGIPNAKLSVFIPLNNEDEEDPIISALYPYKQVTDKNEEGYRYNLLPKVSSGCNHKATGNFFSSEEVINNPIVLEVFEKYYKFSTKTNASGDYMIWGVPLGNQTIHASIDVSDIGCYSMRPYHFIAQGRNSAEFESALEFKESENLDTLPQIVIQNKVAEVVPFWGDDDLCAVGISRLDFDLRDSGVEIIPSATFMGSIMTDDSSNYVEIGGTPTKAQGQLCNLTTGTGLIESVRHTILTTDDGCTPKLEYFTLEQGGKVIDGNGAWVTQLPMNLDFLITNEYGKQVLSDDPTVGIPTKSKYRFRISFDSSGSEVRNGSYLVPNLREYNGMTDPMSSFDSSISPSFSPSYTFSDNLLHYPLVNGNWEKSPAYTCEDYFYKFEPNKIYTIANFIDNYRKNIPSKDSHSNNRWKFIGVKSINPPSEARCTDITKEFPVNDAFRGGDLLFSQLQITRVTQVITLIMAVIMIAIASMGIVLQGFANGMSSSTSMSIGLFNAPAFGLSVIIASWITQLVWNALWTVLIGFPLLDFLILNFRANKKLFNYPNCEPCACGEAYKLQIPRLWGGPPQPGDGKVAEALGDDEESVGQCSKEMGFKTMATSWSVSFERGCFRFKLAESLSTYGKIMLGYMVIGSFLPAPGGPIAMGFIMLVTFIQWVFQWFSDIRDIFEGLSQWRVLANIYSGLCRGVFNMKFSNSWVNGVLYHFKFMKKTRTLDDDGQPLTTPIELYPDRVLWKQVEFDATHFYYRSCPFNPESSPSAFITQNLSIDGNPQWPHNAVVGPDATPHCGINFPTTICELGVLDPCTSEICGEEEEECAFIDRLSASSFQPTEELLGREIERKIGVQEFDEFIWSGVNKWFGAGHEPGAPYIKNVGNIRKGSLGTKPVRGRVIDGDIAQLLATNNMGGVSVFTRDISDPYYGQGAGTSNSGWYDEYGKSDADAVTAIASTFPLMTKDDNLINCLMGGIYGVKNTQVVPYYKWEIVGIGYGNLDNDYTFGTSPVESCPNPELGVMGYQQGILYNLPLPGEPNGSEDGNWTTPPYYGGLLGPPSQFNFVSNLQPFVSSNPARLGTGLFYYFGLRQGSSAYDLFLNEFLPPQDNE